MCNNRVSLVTKSIAAKTSWMWVYKKEIDMARIENHRYSIDEAFRECFYIVPDYQREYVWTEKQVHQVLDVIDSSLDDLHFGRDACLACGLAKILVEGVHEGAATG